MTRSILSGMLGLISVFAVGGLPLACQSGGIGDPCIPEDEYKTDFAGFKVTEENIESRSFQCQTRICLVNHFQGRVSCPYGQPDPATAGAAIKDGCQAAGSPEGDKDKHCCVPGTDTPIEKEICGQCAKDSNRNADQAVYCSCRCDVAEGEPPDPNFNFCDCPDGYECKEIRPNVGLGDTQLTGKYCIKSGTMYESGDEAKCGNVIGNANPTQCAGN